MIPKERIQQLKEQYHTSLFDDVVPWWEEHSIDTEHGGYHTRLERDGHVYSGDKDMWMTGREVWFFAHLYNTHRQEDRWRNYALHGLDFMRKHAMKADGTMYFRLDSLGNPLSDGLSIYTEVFASIAMAECASFCDDKTAGDKTAKDLALRMYKFLISRLGLPTDTPMLCYPLLDHEFHLHAHDMCRITIAKVFRDVFSSSPFEDDITMSIDSIIDRHWKPEHGYLLENVSMDGSAMLEIPEGRLFHPGHTIESAWMILEIAHERNDTKLQDTAIDMIIASLEHGWDKEYGGIRYLTNIDWTPCHNLEADLKLWWPHCEALYGLLLACLCSDRDDLWAWYEKIHEYTFSNFPDAEHGEWYGYLNRDASKIWTAKANGWKGMFHLPRVLYRCYQLLSRASG